MFKQIFIGNILESFYSSYKKLPKEKQDFWMLYDALENNRSLMYQKDEKVLITPKSINALHFKKIMDLAGWKNVINLFPQKYSYSICEDLLKDQVLKSKFIDIIKNNPGIELIAYRNTKEFYSLIDILKRSGLDFRTPEVLDKENIFIEKYYHSKRGFRHLWEMVKDWNLPINIPFGFITTNKKEARDAAYWFVQKNKSFVVKYNHGVQGIGVLMFDISKVNKDHQLFSEYFNMMLEDEMWDEGSIVVEEKINTNTDILGGSPNVELLVDEQGNVLREYACEQILDNDRKTFLGVGINKEVDKSKYIKTAFEAAENYGKKLSELGYRGYFDVDLVVSEDNKLYAVESNLRRTGGTHINDFCKIILGENYSQNYFVVSYEIKIDVKKSLNFENILDLYKNILYLPETKNGVIIYNPDMIDVGVLQLMAIAKSRKDMDQLVKRSKDILEW